MIPGIFVHLQLKNCIWSYWNLLNPCWLWAWLIHYFITTIINHRPSLVAMLERCCSSVVRRVLRV